MVKTLQEPLPDPLEPEWIVVQSIGLSRWLALQLSERLGICANIDFLLPNRAVARLGDLLFSPQEDGTTMSRESLVWKIYHQIPDLVQNAGFEPVRAYLGGDVSQMRRLQFSEQMAGLFDQYPVYRPEMITEWETGRDAGWQAQLWRACAASNFHATKMMHRLPEAVQTAEALPHRVIAFGISSLPPIHLQFLSILSKRCHVQLLVNRPASGFWSEQLTTKEARRVRERAIAKGKDPDWMYLEIGNRLVAALGKTGRDFASALDQLTLTEDTEHFSLPAGNSLLRQLQRQIYDQEEQPEPGNRPVIAQRDLSLQIHGCHSELRELEVLRNYLIDQFAQDRTLLPSDVIVMAPDITLYSPLLEAVFPERNNERPSVVHIPYSVADRTPIECVDVVRTFLTLWDLVGSRFQVSDLMQVMDSRPVRNKFGLNSDDLQVIQTWIEETRIRWGIDATHKEELGLPGTSGNSWKEGIDRLLLGFSMSEHDRELFDGVLPFDNVEGSNADVLSKFLAAFDAIVESVGALQGSRPLSEWQCAFERVAELMFDTGDESQIGLKILRSAGLSLVTESAHAEFLEPVSTPIVRRAFTQLLSTGVGASGFLAGGVTFCELRPLRAVPFRVVCMLGMNDTAFPRVDRRPRFDLMRENPKKGDRSVRDDDRYAFLETVMAARDSLYLSYLARSLKDNSETQPSAVLTELLDYLGTHFTGAGVERSALITFHRLHAFNPDYFRNDPRFFSYSSAYREGAVALAGPKEIPGPPPEVKSSQPNESEIWLNPTLSQFLSFFRDPCRTFVKERMGITLLKHESDEEESEPFETDKLSAFSLRQTALQRWEAPNEGWEPYARAIGILPHGAAGKNTLDDLLRETEKIHTKANEYRRSRERVKHKFSLDFHTLRIHGQVETFGEHQVQIRAGDLRIEDRMDAWIRHLLAGYALERSIQTTVVAKNKVASLSPMTKVECGTQLDVLAAFFQKGICKPLAFFPEMSLKAFEEEAKGNQPSADFWKSFFSKLRKGDYFALCFSPEIALSSEFKKNARIVFSALKERETLSALEQTHVD